MNSGFDPESLQLFTLEEANLLIPTIRPILSELSKVAERLDSFRVETKAASIAAEDGGGGIKNGSEYVELLYSLQEKLSFIISLGIQVKDVSRGLIDFPSERDGEIILLCWQLSEIDEIRWWHGLNDGYAGRKPI